jgi:hypothetical protein
MLKTVVHVPFITQPNVKFLVQYPFNVSMLNPTIKSEGELVKVAFTVLSSVLPLYNLQDENEHPLGIEKYYVID